MEKELKQFLVSFNKAGYASGREEEWQKEPDGSKTISFEKGSWRAEDNYFGGEPYGGRTIVFYKNKLYWIMLYYGWVEERIGAKLVYSFLRKALREMPKDHPFRGPREFKKDDFVYKNNWEGDINRFLGEEIIQKEGNSIYKANYMGGVVDLRR